MSEHRPVSPTVARRRLGGELERLRGRRTQQAAASLLGFGLGKLKYVEWGHRALPMRDLHERVLPAYGVGEADRGTLIELCEQANARGWWEDFGDADLRAEAKRYVGFEQGATRMRDYQPMLFPGLLHSDGYTEAIFRSVLNTAAERVAVLMDIRRRRQQVLRGGNPLVLHSIIDEAVLRRRIGSAAVMRAQLDHVLGLAERHPNVTVQVVPFDAGAHPALMGSFNLMEFAWPDDPGLVHIEYGPGRVEFLDSRRDVYLYSQVFDRLVQLALPPLESLELLRTVAHT